MKTTFSKVNGTVKVSDNSNVNCEFWLEYILPVVGEQWNSKDIGFMAKHAGLKVCAAVQDNQKIYDAIMVYASDKNDSVRIFFNVDGEVTEVFAEDGDVIFSTVEEAEQYINDFAASTKTDEVLTSLFDMLGTIFSNVTENTNNEPHMDSATAIVNDLIKKFGFDADAIYHRNGKKYITHSGCILSKRDETLVFSDPMYDVFVGRIDQLPSGYMTALRTAENLVKIYNL